VVKQHGGFVREVQKHGAATDISRLGNLVGGRFYIPLVDEEVERGLRYAGSRLFGLAITQ
jgi:hypothetical protein